MPLPYSCYLGYFPFINSNVIISSNISIDNTSFTNTLHLETQNLRICTNLEKPSNLNGSIKMIYTIPNNQMDFISFDSYNSVILTNTTNSQYLIYKILSIGYVSSNKIEIIAEPSIYNMVKNISPNNDTITKAPTNPLSHMNYHDSFVEWGYKADSILLNGRPNFTKNADSDLYCPMQSKTEMNILKNRTKLLINFDKTEYGLDATGEVSLVNRMINNVQGWVLIYVQSGVNIEFKNGETVIYSGITPNTHFIPDKRISPLFASVDQPYCIITAPIDGWGYSFSLKQNDLSYQLTPSLKALNEFIKKYSAYILQIKIVPFIPFEVDNISGGTGLITYDINNYSFRQIPIEVATDGSAGYFGALLLNNIILDEFKTIPIDSISSKFFDSYNQYTTEDLSTNDNPYIFGNTWKMKIDDCFGNTFDYSPILMGELNKTTKQSKGLIFKIGYSFEIGVNNYYMYLDTQLSCLDKSIYNVDIHKTGSCLVGSNDMSILYSKDRLEEFLANNKNFFTIRSNTYSTDKLIALDTYNTKDMNNFVNTISQTLWGMSHAYNNFQIVSAGVASASNSIQKSNLNENELYASEKRLDNTIRNSNLELSNLAYAPDRLDKTSSSFTLPFSLQPIGFYVNWYTCTDFIKNNLLVEFITKGIYVNKYVKSYDLEQYINITSTKNDKKDWKYFKGQVEGYCSTYNSRDNIKFTFNNQLLDKIKQMLMNGVVNVNIAHYNASYDIGDSTFEGYLSSLLDESLFNE